MNNWTNTDWTMNFSNEEILRYLTYKLSQKNVKCQYIADDLSVDPLSKKRFEYLIFDNANQELGLYQKQTSLFIYTDVLFKINDETHYSTSLEIMFIDDRIKKSYTISDVYENVVFEEFINDKSHEQILTILYEMILIFCGTQRIQCTLKEMTSIYQGYPKYYYKLEVVNNLVEKGTYKFANIDIEVINNII